MQGLDPVLEGVLEKMHEVTDNSNLIKLHNEAKKQKQEEKREQKAKQ